MYLGKKLKANDKFTKRLSIIYYLFILVFGIVIETTIFAGFVLFFITPFGIFPVKIVVGFEEIMRNIAIIEVICWGSISILYSCLLPFADVSESKLIKTRNLR